MVGGLFGLGVVASGWAASTTYTPASSGWGAALTVAADDTVTLEGATDGVSVWQGAVTVNAGGTLKTTGRVRIVGTTTVQPGASGVANGKLDVLSGELFPTLGSQSMSGDLYIRAGATFHAPAGLTSADLESVVATVKDADGNDYSDAFSVRVKGGKIVLANARPSGMTLYLR